MENETRRYIYRQTRIQKCANPLTRKDMYKQASNENRANRQKCADIYARIKEHTQRN